MTKQIFVGPHNSISTRNLDAIEFHIARNVGDGRRDVGTLEEVSEAMGWTIVRIAEIPEDRACSFKDNLDGFACRNSGIQYYETTPEPEEGKTVRLMKTMDLRGKARVPDMDSYASSLDRLWFIRDDFRVVAYRISNWTGLTPIQKKLIDLFVEHIEHADYDHVINPRIEAAKEVIRRLGFKPVFEEEIPDRN